MNMSWDPSLDTKWILTWETLFNQNLIKVSKTRFANVNDLCCKISKKLHEKVHKMCKPTAQNILVVLFIRQMTVIECTILTSLQHTLKVCSYLNIYHSSVNKQPTFNAEQYINTEQVTSRNHAFKHYFLFIIVVS